MMHSTASSSTVGAHPQHPQPLLHLYLMNSMPQWMVGHRPPTQHLMDNMLLQYLVLSVLQILCWFSYSARL